MLLSGSHKVFVPGLPRCWQGVKGGVCKAEQSRAEQSRAGQTKLLGFQEPDTYLVGAGSCMI
jgi:hypothetical protein